MINNKTNVQDNKNNFNNKYLKFSVKDRKKIEKRFQDLKKTTRLSDKEKQFNKIL